MRTLDDIDPISAITAEIEKAMRAPDRIGIMSVKSANQWVDDALHEPDPKMYFYDLLVEGECTVLFASSNAGKSVLATQMAEAVARENTVLYLDCELSAKQFQMRYVEGNVSPIIHRFPDTLLRAEIRPDDIVDTNLEDAILDSVAVAAEYRGIRHIFVDNITFLLNDSEKGEAAGAFMKKILALKRKYGLTMVIVGHSPKRQPRTPMVQNDLAESAKLMNFFDAGIAIINYVLAEKKVTNSDVQKILNVSKPTATRLLASLSDYLVVTGTRGKGTFYSIKGLTIGSQTNSWD